MNNDRRKQIKGISDRLEAALSNYEMTRKELDEKLSEELEGLVSDIGDVQGEEQDAYDNLPESLQNGEKGEVMQTAIDELGEAAAEVQRLRPGEENLEDLKVRIEQAIESLSRAAE